MYDDEVTAVDRERETGMSRDKNVMVEVQLSDVEGIIQLGQTVTMIWEQLRGLAAGFVLLYRNMEDVPANVEGDGFCGYRAFDAVRRGLSWHTDPITVDVVTSVREHARLGSIIQQKCDTVTDIIRQGATALDTVFWLSRHDFRDLICPIPLLLWMVAYDERFNVLVGAGQQGRVMITGDNRLQINRHMIVDLTMDGVRDIVYHQRHFFLGDSTVTVQKVDEALYQIAIKLWSQRLNRVVGLPELRSELEMTRNSLHHIFYPP
jgi:hypothetical protein